MESSKDLNVYRRLLVISGSAYLAWWYLVFLILPQAFNPIGSRAAVVIFIFCAWGLTFVNPWAGKNARHLFAACAWLITFHYYYLFYENAGDVKWVVGDYITVIAVSLLLFSARSLLSYAVFVLILSGALVGFVPSLKESVFLPGLVTILFQANFGMWSRLHVLKNLTESNQRFQLLFNSTFEGVLVHEKGRVVDANESLARILGTSRDQIIGRDALDIVHPDDRDLAARKIRDQDDTPYEIRGLKRSGDSTELEVRGKDFSYDGRNVRLVTLLEISDRRKAEKQRIAAETMKENLRTRDEFITIASHELKTPLTTLILQTQMVQARIKKEDPKVHTLEKFEDFSKIVDSQTRRLSVLVDAMLDVSRISTGNLRLEFQEWDLAACVRSVVAVAKTSAGAAAGSEILLTAPSALLIKADKTRIEQVVENLLTNAIKYGGGKPVDVELRSDGNQAVLLVRDNGIGIAVEDHERIFNRFERAVPARSISGFGLGLFIARQIVEGHGGKISVESKQGVGSTFTVRLPLNSR